MCSFFASYLHDSVVRADQSSSLPLYSALCLWILKAQFIPINLVIQSIPKVSLHSTRSDYRLTYATLCTFTFRTVRLRCLPGDIVALLEVRQPTFTELTAADAVQVVALRGDLSCSFAQPAIAHFHALSLLEHCVGVNETLYIAYLRAVRIVELPFYVRKLRSPSRTTRFQSARTTLLDTFQFVQPAVEH